MNKFSIIFGVGLLVLAMACGGGAGGDLGDNSGGNGGGGDNGGGGNGATYTITFNSNGGTPVASKIVNEGGKASEPSNPTRVPAGYYDFVHWYKDKALTKKWEFAADIVNADITLYAKWAPSKLVGDTGPGGGIIFYIEDSGFIVDGKTCNYLEVALEDAASGPITWASSSAGAGITINFFGGGWVNTSLIKATFPLDTKANNAAWACAEYANNGLKDWYLPNQMELTCLYDWYKNEEKGAGNLEEIIYWSSEEPDYTNDSAIIVDFTGEQHKPYWKNKDTLHNVRAIRAF